MDINNKIKNIIILDLKKLYFKFKMKLNFKTPFESLVSIILSAQSRDDQVKKVVKKLFKIAKTPKEIINLPNYKIEKCIKSIGLYRKKQKYIYLMSYQLINNFKGKVPKTYEELIKLSGVGRKTANVVLSNVFGIPAIPVDTHVFRVANRIGFVKEKNVYKTEIELKKIINKKDWIIMHKCFIYHGRLVCKSKKPLCLNCVVKKYCIYYKKNLN